MKSSKNKKKKQMSRSDLVVNILLGIGALLIAGLIGYTVLKPKPGPQLISSAALERAAKVQTLDPSLFSGKSRAAYQAAKDVPGVLVQVGCYCGCMQNSGHEHNLHCFKDMHGDT